MRFWYNGRLRHAIASDQLGCRGCGKSWLLVVKGSDVITTDSEVTIRLELTEVKAGAAKKKLLFG